MDKPLHNIATNKNGEYYRELAQIKPDLTPFSFPEVYIASWRAYSNVLAQDGSTAPSEYRVQYTDFLKKGFQRVNSIQTCSGVNPITVVDQDLSRLPKFTKE
ncbi:hypothetical protein CRM22_005660 [Opisthorchis felineus]|uniref:Uncharacterized protein n=1 Tax=Opisthorchis felineus TaxID=147828 RepID=A0A4S2LQ11_OPIFE|nr:hypothetical protein CRM22_005660 [Opisthorchis felineus]